VILSPKVNLDFLTTFPAVYYKIKATDAIIDEQMTALRQRFGFDEPVSDAIKEHDRLYCDYQSLENEEIQSDTIFFADEDKNPWSVPFIGHKVGDMLEIDMDKTFEDNPEKACDVLNIKEEDKPQTKGIFKFTITEVKRLKECEIDEDFFKQAYPRKEIKTEKELRKIIAEEYSAMCAETVGTWFFNAHFDPIVKAADLHYDDDMLRQYMEHQKRVRHEEQQEESGEDGTVSDKEFENTKRGTSWQLIQHKIMETNDIKVDPDEVKQAAKEQICRYFGMDPAMADIQLKEYMNSMVDRIMKDEKQAHELYNRILDKKITRLILEKVQTTTKEVTWDEFLKLIDTKKEESADAPKKTRRSAASKKKTSKEEPEQQSLFE
jgi:trigger factor